MEETYALKKAYITLFIIIKLVTAFLLFWALADHPYSYYQLLRVIVCGVSIYSLLSAFQGEKTLWIWIFGITTILFNPILPIHLPRETWAVIDVFTGGLFILSCEFKFQMRQF